MAHHRLGRRQRLAIEIENAIARWCGEPFIWGKTDCLLALDDILFRALGYHPAAHFIGHYSSMRGAARITKTFGGFAGALRSTAEAAGWASIDPQRALVGDIGIIANEKGPRCGVIKHSTLWIGRAQNPGFATVPTERVIEAWRVS